MKKYLNKKCREKLYLSLKILKALIEEGKINSSQYIQTKIKLQRFIYDKYNISKMESQKIVYLNYQFV
ncbi:MAG: hypothetical protein ACRCXT_15475 [Paraclostridium sp.]